MWIKIYKRYIWISELYNIQISCSHAIFSVKYAGTYEKLPTPRCHNRSTLLIFLSDNVSVNNGELFMVNWLLWVCIPRADKLPPRIREFSRAKAAASLSLNLPLGLVLAVHPQVHQQHFLLLGSYLDFSFFRSRDWCDSDPRKYHPLITEPGAGSIRTTAHSLSSAPCRIRVRHLVVSSLFYLKLCRRMWKMSLFLVTVTCALSHQSQGLSQIPF